MTLIVPGANVGRGGVAISVSEIVGPHQEMRETEGNRPNAHDQTT